MRIHDYFHENTQAKPQLSEKFYMGLSKTLPADQIKKIGTALVSLENNGGLKRIFEKYQE